MKKSGKKFKHQMEQQQKKNTNAVVIMVSITVIIVGLFGIILLLGRGSSSDNSEQANQEASVDNVSIVDGQQVIEITAKAGYSPRKTLAKANIPTVIKVKTNGTYDCSIAVRIPSLRLSENMSATDEVEWDIGPQPVGKLGGNCSMGMYFFEIEFQA